MADAGLRLTVEGEKEFKAALAEIDAAVKSNQKAMKSLTEEFKLNETGMKAAADGIGAAAGESTKAFGSIADAAEILRTKSKVLSDSIEMQTEKFQLLDVRVEEARKTYGEYDKRTMELKNQLLDASTALTKLNNEYEKNQQALLDAEHSTKEYDDAVKALEAQLAANQAELKNMGGGLDALKKEYGDLDKGTGELEKSTSTLAAKEENLRKQNDNLARQNDKLSDSVKKQRDLVDNLARAQEIATARYGEGSVKAEEYRKKLADATGQLDKMERELQENQKAIEDNNKAVADGGEAPNAMLDGLKKIEEMTGIKIPAGIEKMVGAIDGGSLTAAGAIGGIVKALAEAAKKMEEIWEESVAWASDVSTASAELGTSTDHLQELEHVANELGTDFSNFTNALAKIAPEAGKALLANRGLAEELKKEREEAQKASEEFVDKVDAQEKATDAAKEYYETTKEAYTQALTRWQEVSQQLRAVSSDGEKIMEALKPWQKAMDEAEAKKEEARKSYEKESEALEKVKAEYYELEDTLADVVKKQDEAREATKNGVVYWEEFGVALTDTEGNARDTLDVLLDVLEYFEKEYPDALTRSAAMEDTFGRKTAIAMNSVLDAGISKIRELMDEAHKWGLVTSEEGVDALAKAKSELDKYNLSQEKVKQSYAAMREEATSWLEKLRLMAAQFFVSKSIEIEKVFGLPPYASGTNYAPGGMALVGEQGPEIVELPRGSKVYPNGTVPELAGGSVVNESNVYNITIDAASVEEFNDIVRIAQGARVGMRRG